MPKRGRPRKVREYDTDQFFANTEELKRYIASQAKRIGWTYEQAVRMANESGEMDYPEVRVDIQKCVWMLEYAEQMERSRREDIKRSRQRLFVCIDCGHKENFEIEEPIECATCGSRNVWASEVG